MGGENDNKTVANDGSIAAQSDDALGYEAYAETLWKRIKQALNRDEARRLDQTHNPHAIGDDPLVIGIFGEWGAGKSFLLKLIEKLASDYEGGRIVDRKGKGLFDGNAGFGLTVPVYFQPWKYEHEPHLHVPFLLHILEALKRDLKASESFAAKVKTKIGKSGDWIAARIQKAVDGVETALKGAAIATAPVDAGMTAAAGMFAAKGLAKLLPNQQKKAADLAATYRFTGDGRTFFDLHNHLKEVTRPGSTAAMNSGVSAGSAPDNDTLAINFVVFVDDLDRCLPETAVATLELIKTMFNVESFAFVLALDEEIIERGIGHRYSDYVLKDKKPQMPITGFEYLEKIVHLPFRLPALTRTQAQRFICSREALIEEKEAKRWFVRLTPQQKSVVDRKHEAVSDGLSGAASQKAAVAEAASEQLAWWAGTDGASTSGERETREDSPQLRLVLASFDAFVPRKLLRIVELWTQIVRVQAGRAVVLSGASAADQAPGFTWNRRTPEGTDAGLDTRVVFAFVLLQLFQPELYRFMRRRMEAFPALLRAFVPTKISTRPAFPGHRVSDIDLWRWASQSLDGADDDQDDVHDLLTARSRLSKSTRPQAEGNHAEAASRSAIDDHRYLAERVRLGVVERLVEHHAAQRHVFNPLKLLAELASQLPAGEIESIGQNVELYFAVLAQIEPERAKVIADVPLAATGATGATGEALTVELSTPPARRDEFAVSDVAGLAAALLSPDAASRANLRERFALRDGALLRSTDAEALAKALASATPAKGDAATLRSRLAALGAIAPWLTWQGGGRQLVQVLAGHSRSALSEATTAESEVTALGIALATRHTKDGPILRAELGDLLNRFAGGDPRFSATNPVLMANRWRSNNDEAEPLNGFVLIPADKNYPIGEEATDAHKTAPLNEGFLIARTATTVAQFARFIKAGGLKPNGKSSAQIKLPGHWENQRRFGNRPVSRVNWFTARAYCRWLTEADASMFGGRRADLPTEWQWLCAARLSSNGNMHSEPFPWGGSQESDISRYANTQAASIEHASAVGCFEPTGSGLYDMAGNVWEWMDNQGETAFATNTPRIRDKPELPALRGGSWIDQPGLAACSFRDWLRPVIWDFNLGFRVVLSLAKKRSVTSDT